MGMFQGLINYILWLPCKWILQLLNAVNDVVKYLATDLFESILFGNKVSDWNQVLIPSTYYRILIVAAVCWLIFLVSTFICHLKKDIIEHEETPITKKIMESLKYSTFSAILLIFIPLFVWILVKMTSVLTQGLMLAFGSKNTSIADLLYNMGNPNWDGKIVEQNGIYPAPSNLTEWNMIVELVGLCIVFICLLLVMINIVTNTFATFFYFILTGFYALTAVFDQGARMKDYSKTIIANNFIICSTMVIFSVYSSLIQISFNSMNKLGMNGFTKMLLQLALACGGGLFVVNGDQYVSRLVGENISGVSSAMQGLGAIKAGAMLAAGLGVAAMKMSKKGLMGRKNFSNSLKNDLSGSQDSNNFANNQSSEETSNETVQNGTHQNKMQQAKENFVKNRQQAMSKYQKGGILALAGLGVAAAFHGTKTAKNLVGSFVGTKASRMMRREQLKEQTRTLGKGLAKLGAKTLGVAGTTFGGVAKMTGLDVTRGKTLNERGNVYHSDKQGTYKENLKTAFNEKIDKLNAMSSNQIINSNGINRKKEIQKAKEALIIKKQKRLSLKLFDEDFTKKSKKWEKYADETNKNKKNSE